MKNQKQKKNQMHKLLVFLIPILFPLLASASTLLDHKSSFKDERGKNTKLSSFKGKFALVTMAYTSCPSTCSFTMKNLQKLEASLTAKHKKPEFLIFSIDPIIDKPEVLKAFKEKNAAGNPRWHFLTGKTEDIRAALSILKLNFGLPTATGDHIMHPSVFILLDKDGKVVGQADGLEPDFSKIMQLLEGA